MTPIDTFSTLLKVNPATGKFIAAGLAVFAAAALIISWGSAPEDLAVGAMYVLAFSFGCVLLAFIGGNERMRACICWILVGAFGLFCLGLVDSVLQLSGKVPRTPCYLRIAIELPEQCERRLTRTEVTIGGGSAALFLPAAEAPERLWLAADPFVQPTASQPYSNGLIYLQITAEVDRAKAIELSAALAENGWIIEGGEKGGELVKSGPASNEVRYFDPVDRDAAIALAETLFRVNPAAPVEVRDFTRLGSFTRGGLLELWVSRIDLTPPGTSS